MMCTVAPQVATSMDSTWPPVAACTNVASGDIINADTGACSPTLTTSTALSIFIAFVPTPLSPLACSGSATVAMVHGGRRQQWLEVGVATFRPILDHHFNNTAASDTHLACDHVVSSWCEQYWQQ